MALAGTNYAERVQSWLRPFASHAHGQIRGGQAMIKRRRRSIGLIAFLKGSTDPKARMPGCANLDHHYGGCLYREVCFVQEGRRCPHFESAVLPTAADLGLKEHVYSLYAKHVGLNGELDSGTVRRCPDCSGELKPRQRYCDGCAERRRRDSYRKRRRN